MDDVGERIEIELVPNDEPGRRQRGSLHRGSIPAERHGAGHHDVADTDGHVGAAVDDDRRPDERRRLVVVGVGVGLVALLLGWTLGRGGGDDSPQAAPADPETTTRPAPTRATVPAEETIAPVEEPVTTLARPSTTRPRTTSDLLAEGAVVAVERIAVDPRLVGSGLRLVGARSNGTELVEADLAAGTAATFELDGMPPEFGGMFAVGDDWVVIPTYNGGGSFVVRTDGTVSRSSLQPDGNPLLVSAATERFWQFSPVVSGARIGLREVDLAGDPTGVEIELPMNAWPAMGDPGGGVIVQSSGRWFGIDPAGAEPLGIGEIVAVDGAMAVLYDCPELDDCGLWHRDRATGETVRVPVEVDEDQRYLPSAWWSADPSAGIAPDRRHIAVASDDGTGRGPIAIIDLETGVVGEIETSGGAPQTVLWSPDGAFVVFVANGGVPMAYELATGDTFPVVTDASLQGWMSIARRP